MTEPDDRSDPFCRMTASLILNKDGNFGGALVIVPPVGGGDPIETLILDNNQSPAQFWATIETKAVIRKNELIEQERTMQAFPRGR